MVFHEITRPPNLNDEKLVMLSNASSDKLN